MRRSPLGVAAMLAMASVGAHAHASGSGIHMPLAEDRKPPPRGDRTLTGYWGIPYPGLKLVSRETLNRPRSDLVASRVLNAKRKERRKARMRLRKRRGWR